MSNIVKLIVLTVQPNGSQKWRLGLNTFDSNKLFRHLELVEFEISPKCTFQCKAVCGTSKKKKAYDFNHKEIHKWIIENKFYCYPSRKPTKLQFVLKDKNNHKTLIFKRRLILNDMNTNYSQQTPSP